MANCPISTLRIGWEPTSQTRRLQIPLHLIVFKILFVISSTKSNVKCLDLARIKCKTVVPPLKNSLNKEEFIIKQRRIGKRWMLGANLDESTQHRGQSFVNTFSSKSAIFFVKKCAFSNCQPISNWKKIAQFFLFFHSNYHYWFLVISYYLDWVNVIA